MKIGETMPGRRVDGAEWPNVQEGDYGRQAGSRWYVYPPGGVYSHIDSTIWSIEEHEDETVTVSDTPATVHPSILQHPNHENPAGWHGYLERGVWRRI